MQAYHFVSNEKGLLKCEKKERRELGPKRMEVGARSTMRAYGSKKRENRSLFLGGMRGGEVANLEAKIVEEERIWRIKFASSA